MAIPAPSNPGRPRPAAWQAAAVASIAFLFLINVYRGWTQSITYDEAYAWDRFLTGPIMRIFFLYHVNNHVLQSLLSKLAIQWFGLREITLRLPSLLGALLYLVVAYRLARHLFDRGWLVPLSVLALGLNPFLMDYFSAARGYGLGLAFLLWAAYEVVRWLSEGERRSLYLAGVASGLSLATNLVFAAPLCGLGALVALTLLLRHPVRGFWEVVDGYGGPALVTAFVFLAIPLTRLQMDYFYYGSEHLWDFGLGLMMLSLFHNGPIGALAWQSVALRAAAWRVTQAVILLCLALWAPAAVRWLSVRKRPAIDRNDAVLLLSGTMLLAALAVSIASHRFGHMPYPIARTVIYWPPLVTLALMGMAGRFRGAPWPARLLAAVAAVALGASVVLFVFGFTVSDYAEWRFDRSTKKIVKMIIDRHRASPQAPVQTAVSWRLEPSTNFYRRRYRLDWLKPPVRATSPGPFDYYLLSEDDQKFVNQWNLRPIFSDPIARVVLAVP